MPGRRPSYPPCHAQGGHRSRSSLACSSDRWQQVSTRAKPGRRALAAAHTPAPSAHLAPRGGLPAQGADWEASRRGSEPRHSFTQVPSRRAIPWARHPPEGAVHIQLAPAGAPSPCSSQNGHDRGGSSAGVFILFLSPTVPSPVSRTLHPLLSLAAADCNWMGVVVHGRRDRGRRRQQDTQRSPAILAKRNLCGVC